MEDVCFPKDPLQSCKHVSLNMFVRAIDVTYQEELSFRHGYWPFIVYVFAWHRRWLSSQATDLLVITKGRRWTSTSGRKDVSSFAHLGILTAAPRFDLSKPHEATRNACTQVNWYRQKIPHELETHRFLYEISLGFLKLRAVGCWVGITPGLTGCIPRYSSCYLAGYPQTASQTGYQEVGTK